MAEPAAACLTNRRLVKESFIYCVGCSGEVQDFYARGSNRRALPCMMARSCETSSGDSIRFRTAVSSGKYGACDLDGELARAQRSRAPRCPRHSAFEGGLPVSANLAVACLARRATPSHIMKSAFRTARARAAAMSVAPAGPLTPSRRAHTGFARSRGRFAVTRAGLIAIGWRVIAAGGVLAAGTADAAVPVLNTAWSIPSPASTTIH
jgi:hypothetical protein